MPRRKRQFWRLDFLRNGQRIAGSQLKNNGHRTDTITDRNYVFERALDLGVGKRSTARASASPHGAQQWWSETRNRDGAPALTIPEHPVLPDQPPAGVLFDHPENVSFEVGRSVESAVRRGGEYLECFVIDGRRR